VTPSDEPIATNLLAVGIAVLSPKQPKTPEGLERLQVRVERLGLVLAPDGEPAEAFGVLNPRQRALPVASC